MPGTSLEERASVLEENTPSRLSIFSASRIANVWLLLSGDSWWQT